MKLFYFTEMYYGLAALQDRRLKQSILNELNDPFEHIGVDLTNKVIRESFINLRDHLASKWGILCFSQTMDNPLLWSHYSNKHSGLCLEFEFPEIPIELLIKINYEKKRLPMDMSKLNAMITSNDLREMLKILSTKYNEWGYEKEVRFYSKLSEIDKKTGLHYYDFDDYLKLTGVYIGDKAELSKSDLLAATRNYQGLTIQKVRIGFRDFEMVNQVNKNLWYKTSSTYQPLISSLNSLISACSNLTSIILPSFNIIYSVNQRNSALGLGLKRVVTLL